MRIGLIDPALRRAGHHVQFLSYLYRLLREAGLEVRVADFGNVVRQQSDIRPADIVNVADWVPTELFPGGKHSLRHRLFDLYREWRSYSALNMDDADVATWLIATYDPYTMPLFRFGVIDPANSVPIIHSIKFFRRARFRPLGMTSFWSPLFLLKDLKRAKRSLCLLEEHREQLSELGYSGRCEYLSYNSVPEESIRTDNREALSPTFRLCTLGIIRPDKEIDLVVKALLQCPGVEYFIGGELARDAEHSAYHDRLRVLIREVPGVTAKFCFLPPEEYRRQIEKSHFTVVPIGEKYQRGIQQTGLLVDSLVNKRPVIGPDVFPVSKCVREHGIGLLYKQGSIDSLRSAIEEARRQGVDPFYDNIRQFLTQYSFECSATRLHDVVLDATRCSAID